MLSYVSLIIPVLNESSFIGQLFRCIVEQTYPHDLIEVIVIDGGSTDGTLEFIKSSIDNYKLNISILHNSKKFQCYALNMGLRESKGSIIIRMDAHSEYEMDYIKKIVMYLEDKSIINVGGVAMAKGYDYKSSIIAQALCSPISIGGARFRYADRIIESETVFPGAWRKEDVLKINGWNEEWMVNEDTEFNMRLKKELKGKIIVDPGIKVAYFPRNSIKKLSRQYFSFGLWRIKTVHAHPQALRYSHLIAMASIPLLSVLSIYSSFSLSTGSLQGTYLLLSMAVSYLSVITAYSIYLNLKRRDYSALKIIYLALCIIVIHSSWSVGSFAGILKHGIPFKAICKKITLKE